jgi:hypothetical protein
VKNPLILIAFSVGMLGFLGNAKSASFTFQQSGISSQSQILAPVGATNLVKAVNVGSTNSSTVNGIIFAADTAASATATGSVFSGNGYTAKASFESSGGDGTSDFTITTINTGGYVSNGSGGYINGSPISLIPNTDYVFEIFLSDYHNNRGEGFTYTLNSARGVIDITASRYITQNLGNVNLYSVSFNSGTDTSFTWALAPGSSTGQHDGKLSGYALFSAAAVPEPSTYALFGLGALAMVVAYRRKVA